MDIQFKEIADFYFMHIFKKNINVKAVDLQCFD